MAISFEQLEEINSKVGTLVDRLTSLDRKMTVVVKRTNTFDSSFGSLKNFEDFSKIVNQLGDKQARNFEIIAKGLTDIAQSVRIIPNDTHTILDDIGNALIKLKVGINEFKNINSDRLSTFFGSLSKFFIELGQVRPISTDVRLSLNALSGIIRTVNKLTASLDVDATIDKLDIFESFILGSGGLFGIIKESFEQLKEIGSLNPADAGIGQRVTSSLNAVSDIIRAYARLAQNREDLQINDINATAFDRIFDVIRLLTREISLTARNIKADPSDIKAVGKIIELLVDFLLPTNGGESTVNKLISASKNLPDLDTKRFFVFTKKFGELSPLFQIFHKVVQELSSSLGGFNSQIDFKGFSSVLDSFMELVTGKTIENLYTISTELNQLHPDRIKKALLGFYELSPAFALMRKIFRELASGGKKFQKVDTQGFAALLKSFTSLVEFIPKLREISSQIPEGRGSGSIFNKLKLQAIIELEPIFTVFRAIMAKLTPIANSLGKSNGLNPTSLDNLGKLVESFSRFTRAVPALAKASTNMPNLRGEVLINRLRPLAKLDPLFDILRRFAGATSRIAFATKKIGDLDSLSKLIQALSQFSVALPKILALAKNLEGGVLPTPKNIINNVKSFLELTKLFNVLRNVFRQLARVAQSVRNPQEIESTLRLLKSTLEVFEGFKGISVAEFPPLPTFTRFINQVVQGLNLLDKVKVDKTTLQATAAALDSFQDITLGASKGNLGAEGGRFGRGFLDIFKSRVVEQFADSVITSLGKATSAFVNFRKNSIDAIEQVGQRLTSIGREILDAGENILQRFGVQNLAKSSATEIAAEFDDLSAQIGVFAKEIPLDQAQEFADLIGIQYPLSANQALAAILDLAKAGQDFASIEQILPTAADLAALSETGDLDKVTKFLIAAEGAYTNFSDTVAGTFDNIEVAADIAFQAADASTASVDSITDALVKAAPAANQYGLTLEDTAAIITQFEDAGIRGAEAGTLVRTVLQGLSQDKSRDELERLGIAWQRVDGSTRPVVDVLQDIQVALADATDVEKQQSIRQFGDTFAQTGVSVLLAGDAIDDVTASFKEQGDSATAAQKLLQSFRGQAEQLKGSFETFLKEGALPLINNFFTPLVKIGRTVVDFFLTLPQEVIETGSTFVFLTSVLATATGAILLTVGALTALGGASLIASANILRLATVGLPKLVAGLGLFTASLSASLLLITTLGVGLLGFSNSIVTAFREVREEGTELNRYVQTIVKEFTLVRLELERLATVAIRVFQSIFGGESQRQVEFLTEAFAHLSVRMTRFKEALQDIETGDVVDKIVELGNILVPLVEGFTDVGGGIFQTIFGDPAGLELTAQGINKIAFGLTAFVERITGGDFTRSLVFFEANDFSTGLSEFVDEIQNVVKKFVSNNEDRILEITDSLLKFFNPFTKVGNILSILGLDSLSQTFLTIGTTLNNAIRGFIDLLLTALQGGDIKAVAEENFGPIAGTIINIAEELGRALNVLGDIFNTFLSLFSSSVDTSGLSGFEVTLNNVLNGVSRAIAFFTDNILIPLRDTLPSILGGLSRFLLELEADLQPFGIIVEFVGDALTGLVANFQSLTSGAMSVEDFLLTLIEDIATILLNLPKALGQTIQNIADTIGSDFLNEIGVSIENGDIFGIVESITQKLSDVIISVLNNLGKSIALVGERTGNQFLYELGIAIKRGNISQAVELVSSKFFEVFQAALELVFNSLVNIFDDFLDLFDDRIVGAGVLAFSGLFAAIFVGVAAKLPQIISVIGAPILGAIKGILTQLALPQILTTIVSFFGPGTVLLISAAVVGFFATLLYTVFNDPDTTVVRGSARRIVDTFEEELEDRMKRSDLDNIIFGDLLDAFNATRALDKLGGAADSIATTIADQVKSALGGVFGEGIFANLVGNNLAQPLEALASVLKGIGVIARGFITNVSNFLEIIRTIADTVIRKLQPVGRFLESLIRTASEIVKVGAIILLGVGAAVVAYQLYTVAVSRAIASTLDARWASTQDALAKTAQAEATNVATTATNRFNISAKGLLKTLGRMVGIAILFQAATVAIEGLGDAFVVMEERGAAAGVIEFFRSISESVLSLLGLEDLIPQMNQNFAYLETIVQHFADAMGEYFQIVINGILANLQFVRAELERIVAELTNTEALEATQFLDLQQFITDQFSVDTRNRNVIRSYFTDIYTAMEEASDPAALRLLLRANIAQIKEEFDLLTEVFPNLEEAGALDDVVQVLADAGALEDAFRNNNLGFSGLARLAKASFEEGLLTEDLGSVLTEEILNTENLQGELNVIWGQYGQEGAEFYAESFLDFLESGVLTESEASSLISALGFELLEDSNGYKVIIKELADETRAADFNFQQMFDTISLSNIQDLTNQFTDGTLALDEYVRALTEANSAIAGLNEEVVDNEIANLTKALQEGGITENEFAVFAGDVLDDALTTGLAEIEEARTGLAEAVVQGLISDDELRRQTEILDKQVIDLEKNISQREAILPLQIKFATGEIEGAEFTREFDKIIDQVNAEFEAKLNPPTDYTKGLEDATDAVAESAGEAEGVIGDVAEQVEKLAEAREEFAENVADINEKFADKERKQLDNIEKFRRDAERNELEAEEDFQRETEKNREQYHKNLKKIDEQGQQDIVDAVANRDSAAAQAAVRRRETERTQEQQQFRENEQLRQEEFAIEQERAQLRTEARRQELYDELDAIAAERDAKIAAEEAKLREVENANKQALDAESNFNKMRVQAIQDANKAVLGLMTKLIEDSSKLVESGGDAVKGIIDMTGNNILDFVSQTQLSIQQNFSNAINAISDLSRNVLSKIGTREAKSYEQSQKAIIVNRIEEGSGGAFLDNSFASFGGPRATGGGLMNDKFYKVKDNQNDFPELFTQGSRTFLIPGKNGRIAPPRPAPNLTGSLGGGMQVAFDFSGMSISGGNGDPMEIVKAIKDEVIGDITGVLKNINDDRKGI